MPTSARLRTEGKSEQVKGKLTEVAGSATGSKKTKARGKAEKVKGKVKDTAGRLASKR